MPSEPPSHGNVVRLPNERLRQAMISTGVTTKSLARTTGVHPRTVQRWLDYHRPPKDRDLREQVAKLLQVDADYLWPAHAPRAAGADELVGYYPTADAIPAEVWNGLFYANNDAWILTDDPALIIDELRAFLPALVMRAASRFDVKVMVHDPDDPRLHTADPLADNVRELVADVQSFADVRLHRHQLGQSIFRFGEEMIVILHTAADTLTDEPALHLRLTDTARHEHHDGVHRDAPGGFAAFARALRGAWDRPTTPNELTDDPAISRLGAKVPPGITPEEHLVRGETFAELTQRFNQIREALLDLDPAPDIRLRLDQILAALDWFDPDNPDVLTPAEYADALHTSAITGPLGPPVRLLSSVQDPPSDAAPGSPDLTNPDDHQ
jgi:lambda repressor-like predicted transcriptional regulator